MLTHWCSCYLYELSLYFVCGLQLSHAPNCAKVAANRNDMAGDVEDGASSDSSAAVSDSTGCPPLYNGDARASDVLCDPCFYYENATANAKRRTKYLGEKSIEQVRLKYMDKKGGFAKLAERIAARASVVEAYFATADSLEALLAGERIVAINKVSEVDHYNKLGALNLPSLDTLFSQHYQPVQQGGSPDQELFSRGTPLCIVTGSSGSGKTYFCLHYLTRFRRNDDKPSVALYLHPQKTAHEFQETDSGVSIADAMVEAIRTRLSSKFNRQVTGRLNMHVCIIFDEAGELGLKGLFESKTVLEGVYSRIKESLAEDVVIVVSGTGITGGDLDSQADAYFFRLKPWIKQDLRDVLAPKRGRLQLKANEDLDTVVEGIVAHPKLRSLTTNARSAYFLVEAIVGLRSTYVRDSWRVQLDALAPALLTKVVHGYISENGIRVLEEPQRRLVAACVFRALREAPKQVASLPNFPLLHGKETAVALSLLTLNVERFSKERGLELLHGESFAISVTPAIAIVLFTMSGVQVSLVPGWRAEEEIAALYASRVMILKILDMHIDTNGTSRIRIRTLEEELDKVRLLVLHKQVQPPRNLHHRRRRKNEGLVRIPMTAGKAILLNGEMSSFADVIAPYMLLQAKHTSGRNVDVDIENELGKCCLLKSCKDDRVLRDCLPCGMAPYP
jgi:hypothetical protein